MAKEIILYNMKSEPQALTKDIEEIVSFTEFNIIQPCDILNPVYRLKISNNIESIIKKCNYCYIEKFKRYYFINSMKTTNGNIIEFSCHVDVLMSYNADIKNLHAVIARQENKYNTYLNDSNFLCYNTPIVVQKAFPSGFSNNYSAVLTVSGGE